MKVFLKKIRIDFFLILLILISLLLAYKNYTPGTTLSGWDTIHPEFDMNQYLRRISSVWQEHQGLGAPPSQAHASEIPRMLLYTIFYLLFPLTFIRYSYIFLMMILGPVGVYCFIKYLLKEECHHLTLQISAFLGGLFYLLNLGTMQHFVVPLEMFVTKFGFLGFIYLFATKFLDHGYKRDLVLFLTIIFFSTPMAHTATLWYVFYFGLVLYCITIALFRKKDKKIAKRALLLLFLTFTINAYWILPHLYYSYNYGKDVITSKIHRLFTEEAYYYNKKYGSLSDFLLFKNFLFDWRITNNQNKIELLLSPWIEHLKNPFTLLLGYFFGIISFIGILFAFIRKRAPFISLIPIFFFSAFFLLSDVGIFSTVFDALRNSSPLIKEVLRFPFTKFSLYIIFTLSIFFGYIHSLLLDKIQKFLKKDSVFFSSFYFYLFLFLIISYSIPAFEGSFVSKVVRVKIPSEYYSLFIWSQKQNNGRILTLPFNSLFGWIYYQWNSSGKSQVYQGAGFTWFGLKQASLNREFDRWYPYNEQAYREFWYAVNSNNVSLFETLLTKYQIKYLLLDENVILTGDENQQKKLLYPELKRLLSSSRNIKFKQRFGEKISLYEYVLTKESPIQILNSYKVIKPSFRWNYIDQAYIDFGDYVTITDPQKDTPDIVYPARNILSEKERINKNILNISSNSYTIRLDQTNLSKGLVKVPNIANVESEFYADIFASKKDNKIRVLFKYLLPYLENSHFLEQEIELSNNSLLFSLNKQTFSLPRTLTEQPIHIGEAILSTQNKNTVSFYDTTKKRSLAPQIPNLYPRICSDPQENQLFGAEKRTNGLQIYGRDGKVCVDIPLKDLIDVTHNGILSLNFNYSIDPKIESRLCIFDKTNNRCIPSVILKKFIFTQEAEKIIFPVNKDDRDNLFLQLTLDTINQSEIKTLSITNIQIESYNETSSLSFLPKLQELSLRAHSNILKGDFPQDQVQYDIKKLMGEKKDCSFEKAKLIKKEVVDILGTKALEYQSQDGNICEDIFFPQLSYKTGYILAVESQNVSGLPFRVCFENDQTKLCALDEELSKNKDFDTDYFIIPPLNDNSYGYNLILTNRSIGNLLTINRLKNVRIIPFPYHFFQSLKWENDNQPIQTAVQSSIDQKQYSPTFYSLLSKNLASDSSIIYLNQAYEKNWRAYQNVPEFIVRTPTLRYLSPLFGQELKKHVLVNNWANGWELDQKSKIKDQRPIVIIFLPQYLEFLGFGLLLLTLGALLV